jgi:hypothetical protein
VLVCILYQFILSPANLAIISELTKEIGEKVAKVRPAAGQQAEPGG